MLVAICGPNLRDQSKGQFHVHAADCADLKHYGRRGKHGGDEPFTLDAESRFAVSEFIYGDHLSDEGLTTEDPEGKEMLMDYLSDFHFPPCCKSLPLTSS